MKKKQDTTQTRQGQAILPLIVLAIGIALAAIAAIRPGGFCIPAPHSPLATLLCEETNTIAVIVNVITLLATLLMTVFAARAAAGSHSKRVSLIASAFAILSIGALVSIIFFLFPNPQNLNAAAFIVRGSILTAAILLVTATRISPKSRSSDPWRDVLLTTLATILVGAGYYLFQGYLPKTYATGGPTLLARALIAISVPLYALTAAWYYRLYMRNHDTITSWFAIGSSMLAIGSLLLLFTKNPQDSFAWALQIARLIASFSFARALMLAKR